MDFLFQHLNESGEAADTGSATHAAIAAWHTNGKDTAAAVEAMVGRHGEYPLASLDEAAGLFLMYTTDSGNIGAEVVAVERRVTVVLPPGDGLEEAVVVHGTCDQIRKVNGRLEVWDVKTSKRPGRELVDAHQYQVAAYAIGASREFGEPVHPGALLCPRRYPGNAVFQFSWSFDDCRHVLWGVRRIVAAIRKGEVWTLGGMHCRYCPAGSTDACIPMLQRNTDPKTMCISTERCKSMTTGFGPRIEIAH